MSLQLSDPRDAEVWLRYIQTAAAKARLLRPSALSQRTVKYLARVLEQERDYDPSRFGVFKVVQRASNRSAGRSSSDDLSKLISTICYLVVGIHRIHLLPLHKSVSRTSSSSLAEMGNRPSFGILSLTSLNARAMDDALELGFRYGSFSPHPIAAWAGSVH